MHFPLAAFDGSYTADAKMPYMIRIGMVLIFGGIVGSMAIALYAYTLYQPNEIMVPHGEPVILGPMEYAITFEGVNNGNDEFRPEHAFVKVRVNMQNVAGYDATVSGGQFYIVTAGSMPQQPRFGNGTLGQEDLLRETLQPGTHITRTTQFDVPFSDEATYQVLIRPAKEHATPDHAIVCLTNC